MVPLVLLLGGCGSGGDGIEELESELTAARQYLSSLNYSAAQKVYEAIYPVLPTDDPHWPEAAFGYANSLWHQTPPSPEGVEQARDIFTELAEKHADTDWGDSALLSLARIEMLRDFPGDEENPAGAEPILERLVEKSRGFIRHEALVRLAECKRMDFRDRESLEAARKLLTDWLEAHPDNPLASLMWEQLAWMELLDFGRSEPALDAFLKAEAIGFADPSQAGLLFWEMAEISREVGRHGEAVRLYKTVITEEPTSGRAYDAQRALIQVRKTVPGFEGIEIPELRLFN
jgi:tetratricopeptide (TPR) repeat protein